MSIFEIKCPLCKGTLWVDPATCKVVDHKSVDHQKANFDDFVKSQKKDRAWDDKLKRAQEEELKRKAEIEQKFRVAREINDPGFDEPFKSPLDWD